MVLAVTMALVQALTPVDVVEAVTIGLLGEVVLLLVNVYTAQRKPSPKVRLAYGERRVTNIARQIRKRADRDICSIWCSMAWSRDLEQYFDEELKLANIRISRLINPRKEGVLKHLSGCVNDIKKGKYSVTSTNHSAFEFIVADSKEALMLIPYTLRPEISLGIYSKEDENFVSAMVRLFESLQKEGDNLSISEQATESEAKERIQKWIREHST